MAGRRARPTAPVSDGDCYQVITLERALRYEVLHFPDREPGRAPCCRMRVTVTDRDRAQAIPDADPFGIAAALRRVEHAIEEQHARIVDNNADLP